MKAQNYLPDMKNPTVNTKAVPCTPKMRLALKLPLAAII